MRNTWVILHFIPAQDSYQVKNYFKIKLIDAFFYFSLKKRNKRTSAANEMTNIIPVQGKNKTPPSLSVSDSYLP